MSPRLATEHWRAGERLAGRIVEERGLHPSTLRCHDIVDSVTKGTVLTFS